MEFTVEFFDYGRYGVTAKEPRTGLRGEGDTKEAARGDLVQRLREHIQYDYVPPADGPLRSIETITI